MLRALAALAVLVPLLWAVPAGAEAGETYCVGSYEGTPPEVLAACAMPSVRAMHDDWHYHNWVTNGQACFVCYDEEDSTCETKFLRRNRGTWRRADPYECARLYGEVHGAGNVVEHVINGEPVTSASPPPPMQLEARVERISPGPYTAGDKVTVVGAVRDESGAPRPLTGGTFRVTDASGKSSEHAGTVQPDGTVSAGFALPASDSVRVEFIPKLPSLGQNEKLRAAASEAQSLKVEVCGFRARVVQPTEHEALVSGQAIALGARLFDVTDKVPVTSPPAGLSLEFTVQVDGEQPQVLRADSSLSATWTPPASPKPREVRFSAGGRTGERVVCPSGEVSATVSDLGLGFDTSELPRTCYVGLPCKGTVRLIRPDPGTGRQQVDALLANPKVEARVVDTGEERYRGPPRADDRYEFSATYDEPGAASWSIVFQTPKGPVSMPTHEVRVRPQLELKLPAELDFGTVTAGASVAAACQKLDFSGSQGAEEHGWELRAEGLGGCQSRPVLRFLNALGQEDSHGLVPSLDIKALDPKDRRLDICLEVPRCAGEVSPDSAVLRVVPRTPEFKAQEKTVRLRWKVEGRGFLGCHGAWVWPTLALLGFGLVVAGFTQPARFPPGASIRVAGSERGMRQSAAVLLQACPGSSPGFYRDARLGLHGDGDVNGRTRNAVIVLRATKGAGVVLMGLGPLEQQDRRTLQWEPVTDLAQGHVPSPSVLYRAGGTYFKVEL